jgi:hypothetical protein
MASMVEIADYAYQAGLRNPAKIAMAVAIAMAESGGNPRSYNGKGRDESYGLWQINMKASEVGDRKKMLGIASNEALFDPVTNARAMVKISKSGSTWSPWSTYPLRAAAYLPAATAATGVYLANPSTVGDYAVGTADQVSDGAAGLAQAVSEAVQTPARMLNWLTEPGTWMRIGMFVIGGSMVIVGVTIFARPALTGAVGDVAKIAGKVVPAGKLAKAAGKVA